MKKLALAFATLALVSCATLPPTSPTAYCSLSSFLVMKPETAKFLSQNDPELGRDIRTHNATWLRECRN